MRIANILGIEIPINLTIETVLYTVTIQPTEKGVQCFYQDKNGNKSYSSTDDAIEHKTIQEAVKALKKVLKINNINVYNKKQ